MVIVNGGNVDDDGDQELHFFSDYTFLNGRIDEKVGPFDISYCFNFTNDDNQPPIANFSWILTYTLPTQIIAFDACSNTNNYRSNKGKNESLFHP